MDHDTLQVANHLGIDIVTSGYVPTDDDDDACTCCDDVYTCHHTRD